MKKFALIFSVLLGLTYSMNADKNVTVHNSDTGESFEISVPDGLKIYEYNSNWLDSIPYLLERARYGEQWAYEALGDCYRYGKGGVERSFFKAMVYYDLAGLDVEEKIKKSLSENPKDYLSLIYKMIGKMEAHDNDGIRSVIDSLDQVGYPYAKVFGVFLDEVAPDSVRTLLKHNILTPEVNTDEMLFAFVGCFYKDSYPDLLGDKEELIKAVGTKFPYLYDQVGVELLSENNKDGDPEKSMEIRQKAISFLEEADKAVFLSRIGASLLYDYYKSEIEAGRMEADETEMERLASLAGLPEFEKIFISDN